MYLSLNSLFLWSKSNPTISTFLVTLLISYLVVHWIFGKKGRRLPPGPWLSLPYVGYLPFLGADYIKGFAELQKKYGPVYRLRLGQRSVLVLNDFDSVKEAFSKRVFLSRPPNPPNHLLKGATSVSVNNGIVWQEQRSFILHLLRDIGFGSTRMEVHIKEEVAHLIEELEQFHGRPVNVSCYLSPSISNIVSALVFGRLLDYDDPMRLFLEKSLTELLPFFRPTCVHAWFPWMMSLLSKFKLWNYDKLQEAAKQILDFIERNIDEHQESLDLNSIRDYMDGFLVEMKQRQLKEPDTAFTRAMLKGNSVTLLSAGSATIKATLDWCLLTLAKYTDVQHRIYSEIEEIVGRERKPQWVDHTLMPYTIAVLMEVQRWKTAVPINLLRYTTEPSEVAGFYIPEGTTVLANLHAVHNDPRHWDRPEEFRPNRFLSPDGKRVINNEKWISFSVGRRKCPGEILANVEIFLYVTSLVQRFRIEFPEQEMHSFQGSVGATYEPMPYRLCMLPRS